MTQEEPDLSARLKILDADPQGGRRLRRSPGVIAAALAVSVIPAGIVYYTLSRDSGDAPLVTQTSGEFQRGGPAWGDLETSRAGTQPRPQPVAVEASPAPAPAAAEPQPDPAMTALLEKLTAMEAEMASLRESQAASGPDPQTTEAMEALRQQLAEATKAAADAQAKADERARELERQVQERDREIAGLTSELSAAQFTQPIPALPAVDPIEVDPDRAEFERRRQEAEEALERRRSSPISALGGALSGSSTASVRSTTEGLTSRLG